MSLIEAAEALIADYDSIELEEGSYKVTWPQMEALRAALAEAESAGAEPVAHQATFDCRLCKHFTTASGGCTSTVLCVDARQFQPTTPRRYWNSAAARGKG